MLEFIAKVYRGWVNFILWLILIGFAIIGAVIGVAIDYGRFGGMAFLLLIVGAFIGFIINVLGGGYIANFLNMVDNTEKQIKLQKQLLIHFGISEASIESLFQTETQETQETPNEITLNDDADNTGKTKLIFERSENALYAALKFDIFIDNVQMFSINNNSKINYYINNGSHTIFVSRVDTNLKSDIIKFDAENNDMLFKLSVLGVGNIKLEKE